MAPAWRTSESADTPTDSLLIFGLLRHDEDALGSLIESHGKSIYGKALLILQSQSLAEEVAQDTLLVLWWHPERFDASKGSLRSFLMGVARFKAIDLVRNEELIRNKMTRALEAEAILQSWPPEEESDDAVAVRRAVSHLPIMKRQVIYLAFYQGLTYGQVAEELGLPEGTVKTRIRDSLIRLRAEMSNPDVA